MLTARLRLEFWLFAMDLIALCGGFGSRLFLWALSHAAACEDWGHGAKCGKGEPF
jgi:hypothetical protein